MITSPTAIRQLFFAATLPRPFPVLFSNRLLALTLCSLSVECRSIQVKKNDESGERVIVEQASMQYNEEYEKEEEGVEDDEIEEQYVSDDDAEIDFEDEFEDDDLQDEFVEGEILAGDGGQGGGVLLVGTWWDEKVLKLAEEVCLSFDGEIGLYAFRTLVNSTIQVRIERLANKSGSPDMNDIEAFSKLYRKKLDEAESEKSIPEDIALEVSSPGVERRVRIPDDLERFKERPMIVKYANEENIVTECESVLKLISVDMESKSCTWGLADVRINREKAGKGRPLNKKQREWRLVLPFTMMHLVRIYSEC